MHDYIKIFLFARIVSLKYDLIHEKYLREKYAAENVRKKCLDLFEKNNLTKSFVKIYKSI